MAKKQHIILALFLTFVGTLMFNIATMPVFAAPSIFVVNSVADLADANNGDGICETTNAGECTLRAAIQQANTNSNSGDQDVINFSIAGAGVHTIELTGSAIVISQSVLINGYTQPGSSVNTQAWPAAMDSVLQIEVDMSGLGVGGSGINLGGTADNTTIKGLVINNATSGVITTDPGADGFELQGNYINTDTTGLLPINTATSSHAIYLSGASSTIGGSTAAQRNVITSRGISIGTAGTGGYSIKGNNINVGSDSVTPFTQDPLFGSSVAVVSVSGTNNQIGGSVAGEGNTISGSKLYDTLVLADAHSTTIKGNHILDNDRSGVYVNSTSDTITIGGSLTTERNIISGNGDSGISVSPGASDVTIKGNYIGVDEDGVTPFANLGSGILNFGDNVTIGGSAAGEGNVISGNAVSGIILAGNNLTIKGNYIGVAGNGTSSVGNGAIGIQARADSSSVTIGGSAAGEGNVISGNGTNGVEFSADSGSIVGNKIGVGSDGTTSASNDNSGIFVTIDASDTIIGGVGAGFANTIANNGADGITIDGNSSILTNTTPILGNSIFDNTDLAIDLGNNGVTNNDTLDPDTGPNDFLNYPVLHDSYEFGGNTELAYTIDVPAGAYRVEFYENTTADPSGHGEGKTLIGVDSIISFGASLYVTETINTIGHTNISATITEIDAETTSGYGATSEFSGESETELDVAVTKSVVDQSTIIAGTISYNVTYTNNGPQRVYLPQFAVDPGDPLPTALFNDIFPNNLTFASVTGDADCSTQNPATDFAPLFSSHATHTVLSCGYDGLEVFLEEGDSLNFTLNFTVPDPLTTVFSNYLLAVPLTEDVSDTDYQVAVGSGEDILDELGTTINNLAVATTTQPESDISISKELLTPAGDVSAGGTLSYELTYTNNGGDALYLGANTPFATSPFFYDFIHPDLSIVAADIVATDDTSFPGITLNTLDVGNPNLYCLEAEPPAGALTSLVKYANYGFVGCWYVGSDLSLAADASLSVTLNFDVAGDSELDFANYAYASPDIGAGSVDPDTSTIIEAQISGEDWLDGLIQYTGSTAPINNLAVSVLPVDITVTSQVIDPPETISEGTPIKLEVTLANSGPASYSFSNFSGLATAIFGTVISGTDLNFDGVQDNLISCQNVGEAGSAFFGVAAEDHPNSEMVICNDIASDIVIPAGGSQTITLLFSAKSTVTSDFGFFSFSAPATDTDVPTLFGTIFGASGDVFDTIDNPNWSAAYYSGRLLLPNNDSDNQAQQSGDLTDTGENRRRLMIITAVILLTSITVLTLTLYIRHHHKPLKK